MSDCLKFSDVNKISHLRKRNKARRSGRRGVSLRSWKDCYQGNIICYQGSTERVLPRQVTARALP